MPAHSKYRRTYPAIARKLCALLGATNDDLAAWFGVTEKTIRTWAEKHRAFAEALEEAKALADAKVEQSLYRRAIGYTCPETKVFCQDGEVITHEVQKHFAPETTAAIFWLKNRQPERWRDVHRVEGKLNHEHHHRHEAVSETAAWLDEMLGDGAGREVPKPGTH